jgi:hypothetical protein
MDYDTVDIEESLDIVGWVMDKVMTWRKDYESNYQQDHDEYYRLWRAQWSEQDKERSTERSRIIGPALQQAVESSVAEVEEATFGRGKFFALKDEKSEQDGKDVEILQNQLMEDFNKYMIRKDVSECLINAAVAGTGIAEVVLEEVSEKRPATRPIMEGAMQAYGVETQDRLVVRLRPVHPRNFLIDPVATSVDQALGVIIDEFVPKHQVEYLQDIGVYYECDLETAPPDYNIEVDKELAVLEAEKVRLTKYYGLVPKELLGDVEDEGPSRYVEAIVVLSNGGQLLKATESPYMMKDRPVVAFPWDIVPGRFWGRGVCEKGYMSQKALDTELRARIDALGLVTHPMLAMDMTKRPRGFKPEVRPGKVIYTNGPPSETLMPFKFGTLDQNTFPQAQMLNEMIQQATGAVDSTGLLSQVSGETKAGAVSMSLGAVIKRHKRTLINFQESFLIPFVRKAAWRYMQFDPENYPVKDYTFIAASTLGIIAREYEVSQLITLMQTMSPESPLYAPLITSIIDNMNLSNREELKEILMKANQPTPEQKKAQEDQQRREEEAHQGQIAVLQATAAESQARAQKYQVEAQLEPEKVRIDEIEAVTSGMDSNEGDAQEFDRRMQLLDRELKAREIKIKDRESKAKLKEADNDKAFMEKMSAES